MMASTMAIEAPPNASMKLLIMPLVAASMLSGHQKKSTF